MKTLPLSKCVAVAAMCILQACSQNRYELSPDTQPHSDLQALLEQSRSTDQVQVLNEAYVNTAAKPTAKHQWLRNIRMSLTEPKTAISAKELLRMFKAQGVNMATQLPLGQYYYAGAGVDDVDALNALNIIFGAIGLDYIVYDQEKYVEIVPMVMRSWSLNIGNRVTRYETNGVSGADENSSQQSGSDDAISSVSLNAGDQSKTTLVSEDKFWDEMDTYLGKQLRVLLPQAMQPGKSTAQPNVFAETTIGMHSINRSTGTVTVQAPRYVLQQVGQYLDRVNMEYSTVLEFEGRLFLINSTSANSEGLDISTFTSFANDNYGLAYTNNALGGVTVQAPTSNSLVAVDQPTGLAGTALGIVSADNLLQVFSAWLEQNGQVKTIQKPLLATTSGVPVTFSQFDKTYINNVSEQVATSEGGSSVGRNNDLVPFEFGTSLRLNPRYDAARQTVRAQISLTQVIQAGVLELEQFLSDGNATRAVTTRIPLERRVEYNGETLLRDGDLVILGGQTIESETQNNSGVTGLKDSFFGPLFGRNTQDKQFSTYYFALAVKVAQP